MTIYIITVLALACYQSFCKLSLLSWRWILLIATFCGCLPFWFEERIAKSSMLELNQILTNPGILNNWCAIIVIQELITLIAGFSLLTDRAKNTLPEKNIIRKCLKKIKYMIFLPSILLPAGILYFQMYLFNHYPQKDFRALTYLTVLSVLTALTVISFGTKLFYRKMERRILTVLHAEYILLLPAIFLPVAAHAKLMPSDEALDLRDPLLLIAGFAAVIIMFTAIFYITKNRKKGKLYVNCNSNS